MNAGSAQKDITEAEIGLERDVFMRSLIRELSGLLEEMVGLEEAAGFISVVGQNIGTQINNDYRKALKVKGLDREQVAQVLSDLKRRINGNFFVEEQDDTKIVLRNDACPFAEKVADRTSLCMMTSNVFGIIVADNLGYGKVALEKAIARGDSECRVTIYLEDNDATSQIDGREYFKSDS